MNRRTFFTAFAGTFAAIITVLNMPVEIMNHFNFWDKKTYIKEFSLVKGVTGFMPALIIKTRIGPGKHVGVEDQIVNIAIALDVIKTLKTIKYNGVLEEDIANLVVAELQQRYDCVCLDEDKKNLITQLQGDITFSSDTEKKGDVCVNSNDSV